MGVIYLDFQKAFDKVPNMTLYHRIFVINSVAVPVLYSVTKCLYTRPAVCTGCQVQQVQCMWPMQRRQLILGTEPVDSL